MQQLLCYRAYVVEQTRLITYLEIMPNPSALQPETNVVLTHT